MSGRDIGERLTSLELQVLRSIAKAKGLERLAGLTKLSPAALGKEIAMLQVKGYIGDDGALTEKGKKAVEQ
ncbi:MAG: hypothetical protein OK404_01835 [Thaumarchaeota archaeon]|nr:hypothetical protein [Nitrososphaerota archaeon]